MAFGKVIVLGEHAVVHGHPALAAALARGVTATARPLAGGPTTLEVPAWGARVSTADREPLAEALAVLLAELEVAGRDFEISAAAELPPGAGLGSSAALAVAVARAIAAAAGLSVGVERLEAVANRAERCFHGNPSGVDVALAARGGIGLFRRGQGLTPLDGVAPLRLAIGFSPEPRTTAQMVARVAAELAARDTAAAELAELGEAAIAGADAIQRGDLERLGALMTRAQALLAGVGVSTAALDRLCALAAEAGALGAKLTGAGGGGAVIALAPGGEERVATAWRAAGFEAMTSEIGARP